MTYDLEASGLFSEGVHEVLLSVTVEIDGLAEVRSYSCVGPASIFNVPFFFVDRRAREALRRPPSSNGAVARRRAPSQPPAPSILPPL